MKKLFHYKFVPLASSLLNAPVIHIEISIITSKTIAIADLAKSETLSDSPENYRKKLAASSSPRRSAVYELALESGKKFRTGDIIRFYMTGTKANLPVVGNSKLLDDADPANRDENSAWYVAKLDELYRKLS